MPGIKEAIAAGNPAGQEIRVKAGAVSDAVKQRDFAKGGALLDEIEALLGAKPAADEETQFKQRLTVLMPKLKAAMAAGDDNAAAVKAKIGEASALAKSGDFAKANLALTQVEGLLGAQPKPAVQPNPAAQATAQTPQPQPKAGATIVDLQKSRLAWDGLRKSVQSQLQQLEQSILAGLKAHNGDESAADEFDETEVAAKVRGLYGILDHLDERLIDKLDEALNAKTEDERTARQGEAAGIIKEYQDFVTGDPLIASIDASGFGNTSIRTTAVSTLSALAGKL
jgi:hypothetical protein